jgi:hypothetical protein
VPRQHRADGYPVLKRLSVILPLHFAPQPTELTADQRTLPEPPVVDGVTTGALLFLIDLIRRCR